MSTTVQVLAIVIGVILTVVWALEIFFYRHPRLYFMFLIKPADYEAVRLWRICIAYYNLTTAAALFIGAYLADSHPDAATALILFTACQHIFLAVVLLITQPKLWLNSIMEALPNVILLIAYAAT
jgi:putative membrane protein